MSEESLQRKVFSGLFWKFGERIGAQLVSFIVRIVLARLLSPSDFGVIVLITVFIDIANVFVPVHAESDTKCLFRKRTQPEVLPKIQWHRRSLTSQC